RRVETVRIDSKAHVDAHNAVFAKRCLLVLSALGAFGLGAFEVALSLRSQRLWRWTPTDLGWLFAVCSLVMLAIQLLFFSRMRRYLQLKTLIVGGFVVMAGGFALLANAVTYAVVMTLVAIIAFGAGVLLLALSVATADKAKHRAGLSFGYQNAAGNFGQAAGSAFAGLLFTSLPKLSFDIVAVLMALTAVTVWGLTRWRADLFAAALLKP
ncbi:MAG TPA: MFS transporter, partial [Steroidobacteraceae bacterium]|nr:MFS transporter [Steroidobacteraceae bacterium]